MNNTVAINILINDKLFNKNNVPIIYYWDREQDIDKALKKSEVFINTIIANTCTVDTYLNSSISYIYYIINDDNTDKYSEYSAVIQKWLPLNELEKYEAYKPFFMDFIKPIFLSLYVSVYKSDYIVENFSENDIAEIYNNIRSKYSPDRVNKDTILNYVMSELLKIGLTQVNSEYIINKLENIIK